MVRPRDVQARHSASRWLKGDDGSRLDGKLQRGFDMSMKIHAHELQNVPCLRGLLVKVETMLVGRESEKGEPIEARLNRDGDALVLFRTAPLRRKTV